MQPCFSRLVNAKQPNGETKKRNRLMGTRNIGMFVRSGSEREGVGCERRRGCKKYKLLVLHSMGMGSKASHSGRS